MKQKICAGGFLMKDEKFLFGKRSADKSWAAGVWDIVGGHALKHEEIYDCLQRETREEIDVIVKAADLLTVMGIYDKSKNTSFKYYIYMITMWEGNPMNISDEHTEIKWFTRNEIDHISLALPEYPGLLDKWLKQ